MLLLDLTSSGSIKSDKKVPYELEEMIFEIGRGNLAFLEKLYKKTHVSVYGFALSFLKNTSDAQDVLHDVYIALYNSAAGYRPQGKPMAWIITVARNLCLMKIRQRNKMSDIPQEDWEPFLESRENISHEDRIVIKECMRSLSDSERQIVVLHALSGFKHREIAQITNLPLSTVLSKYNRAIKKLREQLTKGEYQ